MGRWNPTSPTPSHSSARSARSPSRSRTAPSGWWSRSTATRDRPSCGCSARPRPHPRSASPPTGPASWPSACGGRPTSTWPAGPTGSAGWSATASPPTPSPTTTCAWRVASPPAWRPTTGTGPSPPRSTRPSSTPASCSTTRPSRCPRRRPDRRRPSPGRRAAPAAARARPRAPRPGRPGPQAGAGPDHPGVRLVRAAEVAHPVRGRLRPLRRLPLMLDHLSIQCADVAASAAFYDAVLAPLGGRRILDFGTVIGFGVPPMPDFWLGPRTTGEGFREVAHRLPGAGPGRGAGLLRRRRRPPAPRCCTSRRCTRSTTPPTTGPSCATPTGTTSRPSATPRKVIGTSRRPVGLTNCSDHDANGEISTNAEQSEVDLDRA